MRARRFRKESEQVGEMILDEPTPLLKRVTNGFTQIPTWIVQPSHLQPAESQFSTRDNLKRHETYNHDGVTSQDTTETKPRVLVSDPIPSTLILPPIATSTTDMLDTDMYRERVYNSPNSNVELVFLVWDVLLLLRRSTRGDIPISAWSSVVATAQ